MLMAGLDDAEALFNRNDSMIWWSASTIVWGTYIFLSILLCSVLFLYSTLCQKGVKSWSSSFHFLLPSIVFNSVYHILYYDKFSSFCCSCWSSVFRYLAALSLYSFCLNATSLVCEGVHYLTEFLHYSQHTEPCSPLSFFELDLFQNHVSSIPTIFKTMSFKSICFFRFLNIAFNYLLHQEMMGKRWSLFAHFLWLEATNPVAFCMFANMAELLLCFLNVWSYLQTFTYPSVLCLM